MLVKANFSRKSRFKESHRNYLQSRKRLIKNVAHNLNKGAVLNKFFDRVVYCILFLHKSFLRDVHNFGQADSM